jgi:hypothetical protein
MDRTRAGIQPAMNGLVDFAGLMGKFYLASSDPSNRGSTTPQPHSALAETPMDPGAKAGTTRRASPPIPKAGGGASMAEGDDLLPLLA